MANGKATTAHSLMWQRLNHQIIDRHSAQRFIECDAVIFNFYLCSCG